MANSKYEYVKTFEHTPTLLPNTYIVVRIDGKGFHKYLKPPPQTPGHEPRMRPAHHRSFSTRHNFAKPNDRAALDLMNAAAIAVMKELPDITLAYGLSDEFSFVFERSCRLFDRRESKILTTVVSMFSAYYVFLWPTFFPSEPLTLPLPSFDGRVVLYPSECNVRDYVAWRQVDCHVNNLYNTTFWALVQKGWIDATAAEERLKGTLAADKNEILFSRFGVNYNNEPEIYRKGSVIFRDYQNTDVLATRSAVAGDGTDLSKTQKEKERKRRLKAEVVVLHTDIIKDDFWEQRPWLLGGDAER